MTSPLQQKLKIHGPVVITANRLGDGAVVYRTPDGGWTTDISGAAITDNLEQAKKFWAEAAVDALSVVDSYVAPVELAGGKVLPGNLREKIRISGPTFALPGS
jgi:hypothetical protein